MSINKIVINEVPQSIYYFLLPKRNDQNLLLNMPEIIDSRISEYLSKKKFDLFLDAINKKYSFLGSKVIREIIKNNIYGVRSRELYISFRSMSFGFIKKGTL